VIPRRSTSSWPTRSTSSAAARIQLEATNEQIGDLETERDMSRAFTIQPPPAPADPFLAGADHDHLHGRHRPLLPLVLVLARRLWVRGPRREMLDFENSPRLQRIEQAIESIAVEVERIGEAQRFTTKLLADRQPDAARASASPASRAGTSLRTDRGPRSLVRRARLRTRPGREETADAAAPSSPAPQPRSRLSSRGLRGSCRSRRRPAQAVTSRRWSSSSFARMRTLSSCA
jgi:hypothetical protein